MESRSLVGAWIETFNPRRRAGALLVAPLWERGLKHLLLCNQSPVSASRSLVGAWIETSGSSSSHGSNRVAPLWERGLKP